MSQALLEVVELHDRVKYRREGTESTGISKDSFKILSISELVQEQPSQDPSVGAVSGSKHDSPFPKALGDLLKIPKPCLAHSLTPAFRRVGKGFDKALQVILPTTHPEALGQLSEGVQPGNANTQLSCRAFTSIPAEEWL